MKKVSVEIKKEWIVDLINSKYDLRDKITGEWDIAKVIDGSRGAIIVDILGTEKSPELIRLEKENEDYKEAMKRLSEENYILKNTCKSNNDINTAQKTCSDNCKCNDEQKETKNFSEFKKKVIDKADLGFLEFFLGIDEEKLKSLGIEVKRM